MGAWIETTRQSLQLPTEVVTLYMGAWIETSGEDEESCKTQASHSTWVRGLKPKSEWIEKLIKSHSTWVRGLKRR